MARTTYPVGPVHCQPHRAGCNRLPAVWDRFFPPPKGDLVKAPSMLSQLQSKPFNFKFQRPPLQEHPGGGPFHQVGSRSKWRPHPDWQRCEARRRWAQVRSGTPASAPLGKERPEGWRLDRGGPHPQV